MRNFDIIIYHGNCPDGFTGAWCFYRIFKSSAKYIPALYGQEPPDVTGKSVAIVDFSYPREKLIMLAEKAIYLLVLDHHNTAEKDLKDLNLGSKGELIFDMSKSGAQLAWDYISLDQKKKIMVYRIRSGSGSLEKCFTLYQRNSSSSIF